MNKLIVGSGLFLILVVNAVMGINGVAAAVPNRHSGESNIDLSPQMRAAAKICRLTNYRRLCVRTLGSVNSNDPKEFIMAGLSAIRKSLNKSIDGMKELQVKKGGTYVNDPRSKAALENCKENLQKGIEYSEETSTKIGACRDSRTVIAGASDFRVKLNYVASFGDSCLDGLVDSAVEPEAKAIIRRNRISDLTDNVLMILMRLSGAAL